MDNSTKSITPELIAQIQSEMRNVPFGKSIFQARHFTSGKETPARRYRHVLLQLNEALNKLRGVEFERKRIELDIEEIERKLEAETDDLKKRRLNIDKEEKQWNLSTQEKFIEDAFIEVKDLINEWQELPKCTREQFELGERKYWIERLSADALTEARTLGHVNKDTLKSLVSIGVDVARHENKLQFIDVANGTELLLEQTKDTDSNA